MGKFSAENFRCLPRVCCEGVHSLNGDIIETSSVTIHTYSMLRFIAATALIFIIGGAIWYYTKEGTGNAPAPEVRYEIRGRDQGYFESKNGYYVYPSQEGNYPGVVVIHDQFGLDSQARGFAEQLATRGFRVLAIDLFGATAATSSEAQQLKDALDQGKAMDNMRAAVGYLRAEGAKKIGVVGFGFGGDQAMQLALIEDNLDATVIFYGKLDTDRGRLRNIDWPILGIFGARDTQVTEAQVRDFEAALNELRIEKEIYVYPDREHGFAHPAEGSAYSMQDAQDALEKTYGFLLSHLY